MPPTAPNIYHDGDFMYIGDPEGKDTKFNTPLDLRGYLKIGGVIGNAGQVLSSNGAGANPSWQNIQWGAGAVTSVSAPLQLSVGILSIVQADSTHDGYVTDDAFNSWTAKYGSGDSPSFATTTSTTFIGAYKSADETSGSTYDMVFVGSVSVDGSGHVTGVNSYTAHFKNGIFTGIT
jgi:hypothetical protein